MADKDLQVVLNSGDITNINLGGTASSDKVAKVGDIATAAAIRDARISVTEAQMGTELLEGGELSIDGGSVTFTIAATTFHHVDTWTDVNVPVVTKVITTQQANITPQFLTTGLISVITMDKLGNVVQFAAIPTGEDAREYASIGVIVHSDLATISSVSQATQGNSVNIAGTFADFRAAFGLINISGNVFSVKTLLSLKKSEAMVFGISQNYKNNPKNPNNVTTAAADPQALLLTYRDGSSGWTTVTATDVDPANYDDGSGTLASVGVNNWTIQPIWLATGSGATVIGYGQAVYSTKDDALTGMSLCCAETNPLIEGLI